MALPEPKVVTDECFSPHVFAEFFDIEGEVFKVLHFTLLGDVFGAVIKMKTVHICRVT